MTHLPTIIVFWICLQAQSWTEALSETRSRRSVICPDTVRCSSHRLMCTMGNDNDCSQGICCRATESSGQFGSFLRSCCIEFIEGSTTNAPFTGDETTSQISVFSTTPEADTGTTNYTDTSTTLLGNATEEPENATEITTFTELGENVTTTDISTGLSGNITDEPTNTTVLTTQASLTNASFTPYINQSDATELPQQGTTSSSTSIESNETENLTTNTPDLTSNSNNS